MGVAGLILPDTQAIVWYDAGDPRLGAVARRLIEQALRHSELFVSAITYCEVAWLIRVVRLTLPASPRSWRASVLAEGMHEVPIDGEVAIAATELADFHKDPADRLIVAAARDEGAQLMTADRQILAWPGLLARIDARR